ncbi:hypothetical protein KP509_30G069500 [Ceratopteris richardii]|uniref:UBA domain-containing protein n=1 Tax=Ceratopteris richardii TaxID=49495 RepID=A0A8T2R5Q6_CERRI|nr:hypothetical protein KP509_30G069500 [Ceratopteris richardii]
MNSGPSGFNNAPVSKVVVIACGIASVLVGAQGRAKGSGLSYLALVKKHQFWRVLTSSCIFSSTPELIFGLYLVYIFRVFERQIGSNKYSVFLFFSTIVTMVLNVAYVIVSKDQSPLGLSSGPYGLIFASFVQFYFDIPTSAWFRLFGIQFSDKVFVYLPGLQLLLSAWKRSLIPGICGLLAGAAYRLNLLGIRRIKFPEAMASTAARVFAPLLPRGGVSSSSNGRRSSSPQFVAGLQGRGPGLAPSAPVLLPPPEESVAMLVSMGFDRTRVLQALTQARNDVTIATNLLLEGQS